jgi:broad specificity phosphatase PhoE
MRAFFIRHGESTGNAGMPCHDLAAIELTERGHEQARAVAASWTQAPARCCQTNANPSPLDAFWVKRAGG